MKKLMIVALVSLVWMGCGDDDANTAENNTSTNNTGTNNTATNNTSTNNTSANNTATNNTSTNNTSTNNTATNNLPDEPYITSFEWITRGTDCTFANCDAGFILSTPARTISNFDGRLATINNDADWQAWEAAALNLTVIGKMRNGWECPEPAEGGQTSFRIRARIQDNGPMLHEQTTTGCMENNDEVLLEIQDVIESLERTYLP